MKHKLIRITTVPLSLHKLLEGQLKFMNNYFEVVAVSSEGDLLEKVKEKEGVRTMSIEMTRSITIWKDLKAVFYLFHFFKKENPDIVHTHTPKAGAVGMIAARLAGVPNRLHTVAGLPLLETNGVKRVVLNFVEKLTYACATRVYPNSFKLLKLIESEKFTSSNKLKVIANGSSNGIDTNYFRNDVINVELLNVLKKELKISNSDFVFIYVGRVVSDKGINELVEAFYQLSIKRSKVKLLLVGPTEEDIDPLMETTKVRIKSNANIMEVGYQDDVRPYFAISNVLVFPSYREGFPNVVMQAGAMKLPSIVTDINGCNEIITNSENGIIIPVKDSESIEKAMLFCLKNPNAYKEMKEKTRERILKNYERNVVCESLLEEYRTLNKK